MKTTLLLLVSFLIVAPSAGFAQTIPGDTPAAVQKREGDIRDYYELKRKLEGAKEIRPEEGVTDRTTPPPSTAGDGQRIAISRIDTDRSDILTDVEVRGITAPYEGKEASIRELFSIVDKINALYQQKGYLTARAILPPQKVEGGIIKIRLIEARVGRISVTGNRHTREWYLTSRIGLGEGDLVRLKTLEDDLLYFNATNDVQLRAEVTPGAVTGTTDLALQAREPDNYRVSLFIDNAGGKTVGQERFGLSLHDASLFGLRDPLSFGGIFADGTASVHAAYNVPFTPWGTRLGITYDYSHIWITSGTFKPLDVSGDSDSLGLTLSQPLLVRPTMTANGFAGFYWKKSSTDVGDTTIIENKTRTLQAGGDLLSVDRYGSWFTRHVVTQGFREFGGDKNFCKYNGDLVRTLNLPAEFSTLLRASGQVSGNNLLPSSEQFQLGGIATVRGFNEGLLVGDDGYFVSAELNLPLFPTDASLFDIRLRPLLKGALFVDHGGAFPFKGNNQSITHNDFLTSSGFGLIVNVNRYFSGRVDFGFPVGTHDPDPGTVRVHFSLRSEIF